MRSHSSRAALTACLLFFVALPTLASDVVISQFRVRGPAGGNDEFVEIYNRSAAPVAIGGYKLRGSSASGSVSDRVAVTPGAMLAPGCHYLFTNTAANGYSGSVPGDATYSTGISDTGGLALTNADNTVLDQIGLSSGSAYQEGTPLASLGSTNADRGYERKPGGDAGNGTDSDDNSADFVVVQPTAPRNSASSCVGADTLTISIDDAGQAEGDAGTAPLTFTIRLSMDAPADGVSVHAATRDGTATVAGGDYDAVDTTVTIPAGARTAELSVPVHGDTGVEPDESFYVDLDSPAGGAALGQAEAIGAIFNDDVPTVEIWQIQGSGDASPYAGQTVNTEADVVTGIGPQGFTMQTPDARADADPMTSNGIYVYTGGAPGVVIGDRVDVKGMVDEFHGLTEIKGANVTVTAHAQPLPAPVELDAATPSADPQHLSCGATNFECMEGMRVEIKNGLVTRANQRFSTDPYAEVFVTANGRRSLREPGVVYPGPASDVNSGVWDGNPEVFEMDADYFGALPANTPIDGGARFDAVGVISYDFGDYEFWPTTLHFTDTAPLPRPVHSRADRGTLRVGSLNMLRLCDTDPTNTTFECGDGGEPDEAALSVKLARLSAYVGDVLRLPDVLGAEEVENLYVLQRLAARLNQDYGVDYAAYLVEGHDPSGIDVGYLVRQNRVLVERVAQVDADVTWTDPRDGQIKPLHDRPPLLLEGHLLAPGSFRFELLLVHPKSLIGVDSGSDANRNRQKRFLEAKSIAETVQGMQHDWRNFLTPIVVLGDFNAFPGGDGWVDVVGLIAGTYDDSANLLDLGGNIVHPALWNAVESLPENDRYSFLFTQQLGAIFGYQTRDVPTVQVLDQALLDRTAHAFFRRFEYGRANIDAPDQVKLDAAGATGPEKAIGVSDHDGFVLDLANPLLRHRQEHGHEHRR